MCVLTQVAHYGASYKDDYDKQSGNTGHCARVVHLGGSIIMMATLIIGSMAAAGAFPPQAVGWTALGLGGGYIGVKLLAGDLSQRKVDLISSALLASIILTFGALGCTGVLLGTYVGFALLGTALLAGIITVALMIYAKLNKHSLEKPHADS